MRHEIPAFAGMTDGSCAAPESAPLRRNNRALSLVDNPLLR